MVYMDLAVLPRSAENCRISAECVGGEREASLISITNNDMHRNFIRKLQTHYSGTSGKITLG
jgi:hypothetical protein